MSGVILEVDELRNSLARVRSFNKRIGTLVGAVAIVFCFATSNPQILTHLHAIFSGLGSVAFYEYFRDIRDIKKRVEISPLYFPLLIADKGRNKKKA